MGDELIDVLCFVFPDGSTFWAEWTEGTAKDPGDVVRAWKDSLPQERRVKYETSGALGGFVQVRMHRSDYFGITANMAGHAIAQAAGLY